MPAPSPVAPAQSFALCLSFLAEHHGVTLAPDDLAEAAMTDGEAPAPRVVAVMAGCGLAARASQLAPAALTDMPDALPLLARARGGGFLLVVAVDGEAGEVALFDPIRDPGRVERLPLSDLDGRWSGEAFPVRPRVEVAIGPGRGAREAEAAPEVVTVPLPASASRPSAPPGGRGAGPVPMQELFADLIVGVTVHRGMVRLDLASFSTTGTDAEGRPLLEPRARLVMPVEGFVESFGAQEDLMRHLMDSGVVRRDKPGADREGSSEP